MEVMNRNYNVKNGLCGVLLPSVDLLTHVGASHMRKELPGSYRSIRKNS